MSFSGKGPRKISLPDSLVDIGGYAFTGCEKLEEIRLGLKITVIKDGTFSKCTALKQIEIPGNVTEIRSMAFCGCKNLEKVELGNSVETIGDKAFANCPNLKSIKLPACLQSIATNTFEGSGIMYIELDKDNKYFIIDNGALYSADLKNLIISPPDQ